MVSIAMFNNKGGVGKTTLTSNIAAYLSNTHGKRVLIIDCDPQCNTTQLLMGQDFSTKFYQEKATKNSVTTISEILQPIVDGDSQINKKINPLKKTQTRFEVDLIPGNPQLSIIEDILGAAWHDLIGGDIGGLRKTNWNTFILKEIEDQYDYVFYDLGPSLGSINRSVLVGCQCFITPMGTDIFSILGIRNISEWISSWIRLYNNGITLCESRTPGRVEKFNISKYIQIQDGYLGYTIQQYITKSIKGNKRPTKAYDEIMNNVPKVIKESLGAFSIENLNNDELKLGDVPHLFSLIPLAQSSSCPILKLKSSDGLVGSQFKQQADYGIILERIVNNLLSNLKQVVNNEVA